MRVSVLFVAATAESAIAVAPTEQSKDMVSARMNKARAMADSWIATINAPGFPPFKALMTFTEDGGLMVSQAQIVPWPIPIGSAVFSAAHGEWDRATDGKFSIAFVALIHDQDAEFLGTARVSGTIEVDETMDAFRGETSAADLDPDGNVIFSFDASVEAKRIRVGS